MDKKILCFAMLLFMAGELCSQTFINLEFRPKAILDEGYKKPKLSNEKTLGYIIQRSRINAGYNKDKLEVFLSLQDIRYWGDDNLYKSSGTSGNSESICLHQAWFTLKPTENISVKTVYINKGVTTLLIEK